MNEIYTMKSYICNICKHKEFDFKCKHSDIVLVNTDVLLAST